MQTPSPSPTPVSSGNAYYVSPSGSDANNGLSPTSAWQTIQHGIDNFVLGSTGTTIHVLSGTYSATTPNCGGAAVGGCVTRGGTSNNARLVLQCDVPWSCLIRNSGGEGIWIWKANYVDVVNFDIGDAPTSATGVGLLVSCTSDLAGDLCDQKGGLPVASAGGNYVHFIHNYVHDIGNAITSNSICNTGNAPIGIQGNPKHGHTIEGFQVIGNLVARTGTFGLCSVSPNQNGMGIYDLTYNSIIENNIVVGNGGGGMETYDQPCNSIISNNTFLANGGDGFIVSAGPNTTCTKGLNTVINNISENNSLNGIDLVSGDCSNSSPTLYQNNMLGGNNALPIAQLASCDTVGSNPTTESVTTTFVNYKADGTGDYHLKAGSIAIKGGTTSCVNGGPTPCIPFVNFDGVSVGAPPNIGAY